MSAPVSVPVASAATIICSPGAGVQFQIMNVGNAVAYISNNSSVTTTTGFPLTPGSFINWYFPANYSVSGIPTAVYAICQTAIAGQASIGTTLNVTGDAT